MLQTQLGYTVPFKTWLELQIFNSSDIYPASLYDTGESLIEIWSQCQMTGRSPGVVTNIHCTDAWRAQRVLRTRRPVRVRYEP